MLLANQLQWDFNKTSMKILKKYFNILPVFKKTGYLLKESFIGFVDDNGIKLSASLAYYTIFSLPPLLIIVINISGFFFGTDAVRGELFGQINGLVGNSAAMQIQDYVKNVKLSGNGSFATIISIGILLIVSSTIFSEIQSSINYIWGIEAKPKRGIVKFIKNRLMSFSMIGSAGFLLLVGLLINSLLDILYNRLETIFPENTVYLFYTTNIVIVFIIISLLFTIIFKTLPDGKVAWSNCLLGAAFTSLLFMIGKFAIGAYLGSSFITTAYGAAGSVIVILSWVYYSAIILYFGAEFTKVYAITHGQKIIPNAYSVRVAKKME
jgi:membrane protein